MTDKEIYDSATPEAKRRLALELLELKQGLDFIENDGKFWLLEWWDGKEYTKEPKCHAYLCPKDIFEIEKSLDQCRILELKTKEYKTEYGDMWRWNLYDKLLYDFITARYVETNRKEYKSRHADTATLTADEKLFCLFQAFGVMNKLKEMK